jgi:hypothetical protein
MSADQPCVLIYNPLSGHGHLDSWNAMFISLLLSGGYHVLALTPNVSALQERLQLSGQSSVSNLEILDWDVLSPTLVQRIIAKAKRLAFKIKEKSTKSDQELIENDLELNYLEPIEFVQRVNKALASSNAKPSLVLNMYMDLYRTDQGRWDEAQTYLTTHGCAPWIGVRFIPSAHPIEGYYKTSSLRGMCFLDQAVVKSYSEALPEKQFIYLPDITNTDLTQADSARAINVKRLAHGRKIVFMGGTISATKNLSQWLSVIECADPSKWFFVQIGEIHQDSLNEEDLQAYKKIMMSPPEHLYVESSYLPDERAFNEIIACSDILFAVYRNFKISSNMLGKAAFFQKPILVADQYLMGERVRHYGLGQAVSQDDATQMYAALCELIVQEPNLEGFNAYCRDFSQEALRESLTTIIERCRSAEHEKV